MTPFTTLGLAETATPAEVKKAFRARLLKVHPDVIGHAGHQATVDLIAAYERAMVMAQANLVSVATPATVAGFVPAWYSTSSGSSSGFVASTFSAAA